jgi:chromosomal replication initiator protein
LFGKKIAILKLETFANKIKRKMIVKEKIITERQSNHLIEELNTAQTYWQQCLLIIKDNIDSQAYNTWFKPIIALSFTNNKLIIQLPSEWFREWLDTHYYNLMNTTIKRIIGNEAELIYDVVIVDSNANLPATILYPSQNQPNVGNVELHPNKISQSRLNPSYTFDNFIIGNSNITATNATKAVAKELDNTRFNPLVIYGGSGLGKTHLAHAIGNNVQQNYPNKKVIYVSSDTFTNEFVAQVTKRDRKLVNDFNDTYRNIDVLIVDDIQFFAGKKETQDKFFHIFNSLLLEGKQIILTSDKPSADLKAIDNRLSSRFIAGLNVGIKIPDYNHRKDIITYKSRSEGMILSDEIVDYIAKNVTTNIREIQGTLVNISFRTSIGKKTLTLDLVKEVITKLTTEQKPITYEEIVEKVCMQYNLKVELLESKTRKREIVIARQIAMYLARKYTTLSLKTIGERFSKDHSTAIHSCTTIENYLSIDKKIKEEINILEAIIKNR